MSIILNSIIPGSNLQHKSMALLYHFCHKYVVGSVVEVRYVKSKENLSNALTKGLDSTDFHNYFIPFIVN